MSLRALITNDDGIDSEGLRQLALVARAAGLDVVVAAPQDERSGTSAALSAIQAEGRILVARRELAELDGIDCHAVAAAPAFIAMIACRGAFGRAPDLVLSGINRGANTGSAILHSGTLGAALTGSINGRRGLAVSLAGSSPTNWGTAAQVAAACLPLLLASEPGVVLNLNVPNLPLAEVRGLRPARLAPFGAVQTAVVEAGHGYLKLGVEEVGAELEPDSDVALLAAGYATMTAVRSVSERAELNLVQHGRLELRWDQDGRDLEERAS